MSRAKKKNRNALSSYNKFLLSVFVLYFLPMVKLKYKMQASNQVYSKQKPGKQLAQMVPRKM